MKKPRKYSHCGKQNRQWKKFYKMELRQGRRHFPGKGELRIHNIPIGTIKDLVLHL